MYIEQIYTGCLAEAAYYIESGGVAAIIDPLRGISPYLELAEKRKAKIKYVLETHFHADFVSGHLDLARRTGAAIVFGPSARAAFPIHEAKDGEELPLGKLRIRVLHTPGHTLESACYLLLTEDGKEHALFSGDTLFVGDVGRPDLAVKAADMTQEELARKLYLSLNTKIKTLPDDVIVYPGHGAGSLCGKHLSAETTSTIGRQKLTNYALQEMTEAEFVKVVIEGQIKPPQYFFKDAMINRQGYEDIGQVIGRNRRALDLAAFDGEVRAGALVLDTRHQQEFAKGFIKDSFSIPLDGAFAVWVGSLVEDIGRAMVLVTAPGREEETIMRLARVGYENVKGYLGGGFGAWAAAGRPAETVTSIPAAEFRKRLQDGIGVLDVRNAVEYDKARLDQAVNLPLSDLEASLGRLDRNAVHYIHCGSGYRSMIAASIMKAKGFSDVIDVAGGIKAIRNCGVPVAAPGSGQMQ